MSYRTVPSTLAAQEASVRAQLRRSGRRALGLGFPLLIGPVVGLTALLEKYFPTPEEDAKRELESYQDPAAGPAPAIDPTIWGPLAGLLGTTALVYYVSTHSFSPKKRKRR